MYEYRNLDYDTATSAVNPVVINTWYTALAVTRNVKAYYLIVEQTNTGATAENVGIELTINGTPITGTRTLNSGTPYYIYLAGGWAITESVVVSQILSLDADQSAPLETRSLGIRVRQTTAVDLVSAVIEVNMVYATLEAS